MKAKNLLFAAVLFLATTVQAQEPRSSFKSFFGQESTEWYGIAGYYHWLQNYRLQCVEDTVVNDTIYKIVRTIVIDTFDSPSVYEESRIPELDFMLREDTTKGQLWCRYKDINEEFLIADMTLSIGDTFIHIPIDYYHPLTHGWLYTVREVIETDTGRIIFLYSTAEMRTISFVEGVGSSIILEYVDPGDIGGYLTCCYHDGLQIYGDYGQCIFTYEGIENTETSTLAAYPNPCTDWITLDGDGIENVIIYNTDGKAIAQFTNRPRKIDTSHLVKGVYIMKIQSCQATSFIKIIKQ